MEENTVVRLSKSLQNTDPLAREILQLQTSLRQLVEQDYLQKIRAATKEERAVTFEHPSREVTLLRALSAFADESGKRTLDHACRNLLFLQTMAKIQQGVQLSENDLLEARSSGSSGRLSPAKAAGLFMSLSLISEFLSEEKQ